MAGAASTKEQFTLVVDHVLASGTDPAAAAGSLAKLFGVPEEEAYPLLKGKTQLHFPELDRDVLISTASRIRDTGFRPRLGHAGNTQALVDCRGCGIRQLPRSRCQACGSELPCRAVAESGGEKVPGGQDESPVRRQRQRTRGALRTGITLLGGLFFLQSALLFISENLRLWIGSDDPVEIGAWIYLLPFVLIGYGVWHLAQERGQYRARFLALGGPVGLGALLLLPNREDPRRRRTAEVLVGAACLAVSVAWLWGGARQSTDVTGFLERTATLESRLFQPASRGELDSAENELWQLREELNILLTDGGLGSTDTYAVVDRYLAATAALIMANHRRLYEDLRGDGWILPEQEKERAEGTSPRIWTEAAKAFAGAEGYSLVQAVQDWTVGEYRPNSDKPSGRMFYRRMWEYAYARKSMLRASEEQRKYLEKPLPHGMEAELEDRLLRLTFNENAPEPYRGHTLVYAIIDLRMPYRGWPKRAEYSYFGMLLRVGGTLPDKYLSGDFKGLKLPPRY